MAIFLESAILDQNMLELVVKLSKTYKEGNDYKPKSAEEKKNAKKVEAKSGKTSMNFFTAIRSFLFNVDSILSNTSLLI